MSTSPACVAILAADGTIVSVNEEWACSARGDRGTHDAIAPGADYLEVCRQTAAAGDEAAKQVVEGLQQVLSGAIPAFTLERATECIEGGWASVTVHALHGQGGAVVVHELAAGSVPLTARLRAEESARKAADTLVRDAIEAMSEGFALYDADGRFLDCNARYLELCGPMADHLQPGVRFEDLLQLGLDYRMFPDASEPKSHWIATLGEWLRLPQPEIELRLTADCWIRARTRSTGQGLRVVVLTDVSETKRREAALRASRARFSDFADAGSERFWELDKELRFTYAKIPPDDIGMSAESVIGSTVREVVERKGTIDDRWLAHFADLEANKPFRDFLFNLADSDGKERHFRCSGVPVFDPDGAFQGYRGVLADETSAADALLRAERAEAHLRAAFEMVSHALVIHDGDGRLVLSNSEYRRMYGLPEELVQPGVSFEAALRHGLEKGVYVDAIGREEAWLAERLHRRSEPRVRFDHRVRDRLILVQESRMPDGSCVGTRTDITEVRSSMERAMHAERMQALGTLAGGIAHDFNNLLGAMIGYGELALGDHRLGEDPGEHLCAMLGAGDRARDLVKQILRFGRKTSEGAVERCRVGELVEAVARLLRPTIHPDITLAVEVRASELEVIAVPSHVDQIVVNLVVNAAQAIGRRKGRVEVLVEGAEVAPRFAEAHAPLSAGPCIHLTVKDDGPGVDRMHLQRIFEPFFTTKEVGEGTGMGLAVVHSIVTRYQGAVTVDSAPGAGAAFHVYLPSAERFGRHVPLEPVVPDAVLQSARVLLVEGGSAAPSSVAATLLALGHEPVLAGDEEAALATLADARANFDLVVIDGPLSKSALEFASSARGLNIDLPILICADSDDGNSGSHVNSIGRTIIVRRSFRISEFVAALADLGVEYAPLNAEA